MMKKKSMYIAALSLLVAITMTACGQDGEQKLPADSSGGSVSDTTGTTDKKEPVNINKIKLEDYQSVTEDGYIIDRRLTFNGYEFMLGDVTVDDFIAGTKALVKEPEKLEAFQAKPESNGVDLECYVEHEGAQIAFEMEVRRNQDGEAKVVLFKIKHDEWLPEKQFEYRNIVSCGFTFLGGTDITDNFLDLPDEVVQMAKHSTDKNSKEYDLTLSSQRGKFYQLTISAGTDTAEESDNNYQIRYMIVYSINN